MRERRREREREGERANKEATGGAATLQDTRPVYVGP